MATNHEHLIEIPQFATMQYVTTLQYVNFECTVHVQEY